MNYNKQVGLKKPRRIRLHATLALCSIAAGTLSATQYASGALYGSFEAYPWGVPWRLLEENLLQEAIATGATTAIGLHLLALRLLPSRKVTDIMHGSARWANLREIWRSGLLRPDRGDSVVVGAIRTWWGGLRLLRHAGLQHVLVFAPTGSGKGVGLVVPSLLSWTQSVMVNDLKGELFELTAGFRRLLGQRVYRFAPGEQNSVGWNPLLEIRKGTPQEMGDIQLIAMLLVDPEGDGLGGHDAHWKQSAWMLITGLILYVVHIDDGPTTLARVDELLADPTRPLVDLWQDMTTSDHLLVAKFARDQANRPPDEGGSVVSTVQPRLAVYRDPLIAANTRRSDFFLRDLMFKPKAHALYLVTQPPDKDRLRPLTRLLFGMAVRTLAKDVAFEGGRPKPKYRHRLLMLIDELPAYGKIGILEECLGYLRGYGIKCFLVCQDTVQLQSCYGKDEAITAGCHTHVCYAPNRYETAEYISRRLGDTTIQYRSGEGKQSTLQWRQRRLLTADEVQRVPGPIKDAQDRIVDPGNVLVMAAGGYPIYGTQPLYWRLRAISRRARIPATLRVRRPN